MSKQKQPPIVAELGRPETPEETFARKAESSRLYRKRKTINNLVYSLLVSLGLVVFIVAIVPRNETPVAFDVDFASEAQSAQGDFAVPLVVPEVPADWTANEAEIRTSADGVSEWYIGFLVGPKDAPTEYVGVSQGIGVNPTWLLDATRERTPTGTVQVGGLDWIEYDATDLSPEDAGNHAYMLVLEQGDQAYLVYGNNKPETVTKLAELVAADLD